jgi:hypothetical protein
MLTEEEYHALKETYKFLCCLRDHHCSPRLPKDVRRMADKCLEHYPNSKDYHKAADTFYFFNPR